MLYFVCRLSWRQLEDCQAQRAAVRHPTQDSLLWGFIRLDYGQNCATGGTLISDIIEKYLLINKVIQYILVYIIILLNLLVSYLRWRLIINDICFIVIRSIVSYTDTLEYVAVYSNFSLCAAEHGSPFSFTLRSAARTTAPSAVYFVGKLWTGVLHCSGLTSSSPATTLTTSPRLSSWTYSGEMWLDYSGVRQSRRCSCSDRAVCIKWLHLHHIRPNLS